MKKIRPINSSIFEFFILILLALVSLFYFSSCTTKALQLAKEKASPENATYWKIKSVVSAIKKENGDVSVCVDLKESAESADPKLNTLTLPLSILRGDSFAVKRFGLHSGDCSFDNETCYWYPIEKAKPGCESVGPGALSSASVLPVENIQVHDKSRHQLYTLLHDLNEGQPMTEKIYAVRFVYDAEDTKEEKDTLDDEVQNNNAKESKEIFLTYWPAGIGQQDLQPISLAGAYEDNSTVIYYLIVPLAFVGDVAAVTAFAVVYLFLRCPECFLNN